MKKLKLSIYFLVLLGIGITQISLAQAGADSSQKAEPTRQQTIDWLVSKINGAEFSYYLDPKQHAFVYSLSGNAFKVEETVNGMYTYTTAFDLNNIDTVELPKKEKGLFAKLSAGSPKTITIYTKGNKVRTTWKDGNGVMQESRGAQYLLYLNWDAEPNLMDRMGKALNNIAKDNKANTVNKPVNNTY